MTLTNAINSSYSMAVGGFINGEKFTKTRFYNTVTKMLCGNDKYIFQIALPDGWWFCKIIRGEWGYDFIVPDTREQEDSIIKELVGV